MNIFKTRYKIEQDESWGWCVSYREWYCPWWRIFVYRRAFKDAMSHIPKSGVIVG